MIAKTPEPPYYTVIFTSNRTEGDNGYSEIGDKMFELVKKQKRFLGVESASKELGITISYWRDLNSIKNGERTQLTQLQEKKDEKNSIRVLK